MSATPHYAAPLSGIDQLLELSKQRIHVRKAISGTEPFFQGHYPDYPIFPGVLILEVVHQACLLYVARMRGTAIRPRMSELVSVRFLAPLRPGDQLTAECRCAFDAEPEELTISATCWRADAEPVKAAQLRLIYLLEESNAAV